MTDNHSDSWDAGTRLQ